MIKIIRHFVVIYTQTVSFSGIFRSCVNNTIHTVVICVQQMISWPQVKAPRLGYHMLITPPESDTQPIQGRYLLLHHKILHKPAIINLVDISPT